MPENLEQTPESKAILNFEEGAKKGEPVGRYLDRLSWFSSAPYLIFGIWNATQGEWGLAATSLAGSAIVTSAYEKLYSSYLNTTEEKRLDIRQRIQKLNVKLDRIFERAGDFAWNSFGTIFHGGIATIGAAVTGTSLKADEPVGVIGGSLIMLTGLIGAKAGIEGDIARHLRHQRMKDELGEVQKKQGPRI